MEDGLKETKELLLLENWLHGNQQVSQSNYFLTSHKHVRTLVVTLEYLEELALEIHKFVVVQEMGEENICIGDIMQLILLLIQQIQ